jgi:F420-dependent oxidoreductase-like protein
MRIGLTAQGATPDAVVEHVRWVEASGFTSAWFSSATAGDPVVAMALAGRATARIEIGTAVLQTYPCHPLLQANRAASVVAAMGRPDFTLGVGPSHGPLIRETYGLSYDSPGRNTEEYVAILAALLRGEAVAFDGVEWSTHGSVAVAQPVPVLVAALSPRLLRVAGGIADGTITYLANARLLESRIVPQVHAIAAERGRPTPRIVAGIPVAVHDDVQEARDWYGQGPGRYATLPNYQRVVAAGGASTAGDVAVVGDEASVSKQLQAVIDAGATDIWAGIFPVGDDASASLRRTTDLLATLAG